VVNAQAHGTGSEQELLLPAVTAIAPLLTSTSLVTADAGYHSDANRQAREARGIEALIADNDMQRRDPRFTTQARHKTRPDPLHDKTLVPPDETSHMYPPRAFAYDPDAHVRLPGGQADASEWAPRDHPR
jgi:hypothetical protein